MGYGFYGPQMQREADGEWHDRFLGYMVLATCDWRGCEAEIDRGLGYLCGQEPHDPFGDGPGCGRYYCGRHLGFVGPRGGCRHRGGRAWGRALSCMAQDPETGKYCCDRAGHKEPHAWEPEPK